MSSAAIPTSFSVEQKRAATAWAYVAPMEREAGLRREYYSLIREFPSMVQAVGFAQALAFLMAKAPEREAHRRLCHHLTGWLCSPDCPVPWTQPAAPYQADPDHGLMRRLLDEPDPELWRYVEEEAMAFAVWLKRFAEAITPAEERQGEPATR